MATTSFSHAQGNTVRTASSYGFSLSSMFIFCVCCTFFNTSAITTSSDKHNNNKKRIRHSAFILNTNHYNDPRANNSVVTSSAQ
jgi:hypothetical protein